MNRPNVLTSWTAITVLLAGLAIVSTARAGGGICSDDSVPTSMIMGCAAAGLVAQLPHNDFCGGVNLCHLLRAQSTVDLQAALAAAGLSDPRCQGLPSSAPNVVQTLAGTGAGCAAVLDAKPEVAQGLQDACKASDKTTEVAGQLLAAFADGYVCVARAAGAAAIYIVECTDAESEPEASLDVCLSASGDSRVIPSNSYKPPGRDAIHNNLDRGWIARRGCVSFNYAGLDAETAAEVCGKVLERGDGYYRKCGYVVEKAEWRRAVSGETARDGLRLGLTGRCVNTYDGTFAKSDTNPLLKAAAFEHCGTKPGAPKRPEDGSGGGNGTVPDSGYCDGFLVASHGWKNDDVRKSFHVAPPGVAPPGTVSGHSVATIAVPTMSSRSRILAQEPTLGGVADAIQKTTAAEAFLLPDFRTSEWWSQEVLDRFKNGLFRLYNAPAPIPRSAVVLPTWITIEPAATLTFGLSRPADPNSGITALHKSVTLLQEHTIRIFREVDGQREPGSTLTYPIDVIRVVTCPMGGPECQHYMYRFRELGPGFHKMTPDLADPRREVAAWSLYLASPGAIVLERNKVTDKNGKDRDPDVEMEGVPASGGYLKVADFESRDY